MSVDRSRRDDQFLSRDHLRVDSDDQPLVDAVLRVGVARFPDRDDLASFDPNVALDDAVPVDDDRVRDDHVERVFVARARPLTHPFPHRLAASKLELVSVRRTTTSVYVVVRVSFNLDPQRSVAQPDAISRRRSKHGTVTLSRQRERFHFLSRTCCLCLWDMSKPSLDQVVHDLTFRRVGDQTLCRVDERVASRDEFVASDLDERDRLDVARFEPHRRAGGDVQPFEQALFPIERQGLVRFREMEMRSNLFSKRERETIQDTSLCLSIGKETDLDGTVSSVGDLESNSLSVRVQNDVSSTTRDRSWHIVRVDRFLVVGFVFLERASRWSRQERTVQGQRESVPRRVVTDRRVHRDEEHAVGKSPFDLDLVQQVRHGRFDLGSPEDSFP